jgi:chorismate dehydratase
MSKPIIPIRVGQINFTNAWPITFYFPADTLGNQVKVITQVPTQLNQAMSSGNIDIGPISSFEYAVNYERYLLCPDLSVSALGRVNSILLFHKKPFDQVKLGKIALPTTSATSVNLLKIIMEKFYGGQPSYHYASPSLNDMMKKADAALLIGDDAIRARWSHPDYEIKDLGEEWTNWTGHSMSFAVWAIRKEAAEIQPHGVEAVFQALQWSKALGLRQPEPIIRKAQADIGGTYDFWREYFSRLSYAFGTAERTGLKLYFQYAKELGLIRRQPPMHIWTNKKVVQVTE